MFALEVFFPAAKLVAGGIGPGRVVEQPLVLRDAGFEQTHFGLARLLLLVPLGEEPAAVLGGPVAADGLPELDLFLEAAVALGELGQAGVPGTARFRGAV